MKKRREMVKNTASDSIEYTEICKTLKKKAKDIRKYNLDTIRKTETSKSLKKFRRTHILGKNTLITLLDIKGRKIQDQDKFYTELYDSNQTITIRTDPSVTIWEVEAALKKIKNGKATGNESSKKTTKKT